jgi:hypothetical protein
MNWQPTLAPYKQCTHYRMPRHMSGSSMSPHLSAAHADVLPLGERLADVHLAVAGADHLHLGDLAVDDLHGQVELADHAERDGAAARLRTAAPVVSQLLCLLLMTACSCNI